MIHRYLLVLAFASIPLAARAQTEVQGRMCANFSPLAYGCGQTNYLEKSQFDATVSILKPNGMPNNRLLVYFHGHGGFPTGNKSFLTYAAGLGYDVISLDYDYGRDYDHDTAWIPSDAICSHPCTDGNCVGNCNVSLPRVCGCYNDCYGLRWKSIWKGINSPGLPSVHADWSINARLLAVINWMRATADPVTAQRYTDHYRTQSGEIGWLAITLAGHSLGASLAGYIAKWQKVERVIVMSGMGDYRSPGLSSNAGDWGTGYGCGSLNGYLDGNPYNFHGGQCDHTTYGYGGGTACTLTTDPPLWIADNDFYGDLTKTNWATDNGQFFGFEDSNDAVCPWFGLDGAIISTQRNWRAIDLWHQRLNGYSYGWNIVGDYAEPLGPQPGGWHGVVSARVLSPTLLLASQICNAGTVKGHDAVIADHACDNSGDDTYARLSVWDFLLTAPIALP
jgi:hypothetical protein